MSSLTETMARAPVVPLVQAGDAATAVQTAEALVAGGLTVIEVVLRTDTALDCLSAVANEIPAAIAGAGTVLTPDQAGQAIEAGAKFLVSPGLEDGVVDVARQHGIPIFPGIYTPSELQHAVNLGLDVVKFFPASLAGGVPALKALSSVFGGMKFMPTGGVSPDNLGEFLALPSVLACGGSWLTPADAIQRRDFPAITELARDALAVAASITRT